MAVFCRPAVLPSCVLFALMLMLSEVSAEEADESRGGEDGSNGGGVTRPEFVACKGKAKGDTCEFEGKTGSSVKGICNQIGKMPPLCMVREVPGGGGETKPVVVACKGKKRGDRCEFEGKEGASVKGICYQTGSMPPFCMVREVPGGGRPEFVACKGKAKGDTCEFEGKTGSSVKGICNQIGKMPPLCMVREVPGGSGGMPNKPELAACKGKEKEDHCKFEGKDGATMNGKCFSLGKRFLFCKVGKGPGGDKPALAACKGKEMKDACEFDGKDGAAMKGKCYPLGKKILVCKVRGGGGSGGRRRRRKRGGGGGGGGSGARRRRRSGQVKDKAMVKACEEQDKKDECTFEMKDREFTGTCVGKKILWCKPVKPEYKACKDKNKEDECTFQGKDGDAKTGTCVGKKTLKCKPA